MAFYMKGIKWNWEKENYRCWRRQFV